jgi:protein transport protein HofC
MTQIAILALAPIILFLGGFALLWALSRAQRTFQPGRMNVRRLLMRIAGWTLLMLGLFAGIGLMTHAFVVLTWTATAVVLIFIWGRYRNEEAQALLWVLAVAAERKIPLEAAVRALAVERTGMARLAILDLADYLAAGVPLSLALRRSRIASPPEVLLAADIGQQTGSLGTTLRDAAVHLDEYDTSLRSIVERLFYLVAVVFFTVSVVTFLMIKIVPVFSKMLDEFAIETPALTDLLIQVAEFVATFWPLVAPLLAAMMVVLAVGLLYYAGFSLRSVPLFNRLWRRADSALIMRCLAAAIRDKRPVSESIRMLAGYFPLSRGRRKLERAARHIDSGGPWFDVLRDVGLITRAESVLFQSAERVGNLPWALEEMADGCGRRSAYRLRAAVSVVFPVMLVVLGSGVFLIAIGLLMPLFSMIQVLA